MSRPDPASSPLSLFGAMMRYYRVKAGMSQDELGARIHYSGDTIGKIETGLRPPTAEVIAAVEAVPEMNTGGALAELREHLKDALKIKTFPAWFAGWPIKEAEALTLRWFEPLVAPGLLQTAEYARAVLRTRVGGTDEEIEEMVSARMDRQAILAREKPPTLWVIVDEGVLHRPVGGGKVMHDQTLHLAGMARRPNIVVQVIPAGVGAHEGLRGGAFIVADFADAPSAGYQDTAVRGQVIEHSDDLMSLTVLWETLKAEALPRSASLGLIEEVAETWT